MTLSPMIAKIFSKLNSPAKIQDYLDALPINFEKNGDTCSSPQMVIERRSAHCIEAALLAAAAMIYNGQKPLLLDLKANTRDYDHVVCLFRQGKFWGAISKSNHAQLRYREPVYVRPRELAMSFFHEYLNSQGEKTLRSHSRPVSLKKYGTAWVTSADDLWEIANDLDEIRHFPIVPKKLKLKKASSIEKYVGNITEWSDRTGKMLKYKDA
jgi:hypothetical protein